MSRGTVSQRIAALLASSLLREGAPAASDGGRPARSYEVNPDYRNLIGVDLGEHVGRACLLDLHGRILDQTHFALDLRADPEITLRHVVEASQALSLSNARTAPVAALGLAVPAPVDVASGHVVKPSVMYGWENLDIREWITRQTGLTVVIDKDVNLMCLAEHRLSWPSCENFAFIKIGTGIGCGIITGGNLLRGVSGTAGDLGHIQHRLQPYHLCRCGKKGCTEAHAAGWALARDLRAKGFDCEDARDVMRLWTNGEPEALKLIHMSSRVLGKVSADLVAMINPEVLVIGGQLAATGEAMLAGVRELIYQRCLPLATQNLDIRLARNSTDLAVCGAAFFAMDTVPELNGEW
ncbi:glucokinase [Palleronia aestuarii]|uniref:Glucokinase n=1 Tax=Palleronia aestuarii TaxID=568105 RepID=A0A2W7N1W7_9RHOB|nr:glucokinase [Palleronia aestuarii]